MIGSPLYWLLLRVMLRGRPSGMIMYSLDITLLCALFCALLLWPFLGWRMGKDLKTPLWRADEPVNHVCGAALGAFVLTTWVWLAVQGLYMDTGF